MSGKRPKSKASVAWRLRSAAACIARIKVQGSCPPAGLKAEQGPAGGGLGSMYSVAWVAGQARVIDLAHQKQHQQIISAQAHSHIFFGLAV